MTDKLSEVDIPDDLERRLREVGGFDPVAELCSEAADRIHKLELDLHFQKLQKVEWACYACVEKSEAATARIEELEKAVVDLVQHVSRADLAYSVKTETKLVFRALMENKND
jgi:hypothetical protein